MAYGEIKVSSADVLMALTKWDLSIGYVLNEDGETIADLIARHIIAKLTAKLSAPDPES